LIVSECLNRPLRIAVDAFSHPEDWYAIFPDTVVGGAILDRLVSSAIKIITTKGRSYRREVMGTGNRSLGDATP